jgi:hypothetical protein
MLGDLLDVDEPFFIDHRIRAAHHGGTLPLEYPLYDATTSPSEY